jgi:hypothetical protein
MNISAIYTIVAIITIITIVALKKEIDIMTRFEKEISGSLGTWWYENAKKEVARAVNKARTDAIVEEDGAIKWKCNGRYLMDELCEKLEYADFNFSREATRIKRDIQIREEIEEYKRRRKEPSEEELFEMRATFGKNTVVVNIITGKQIKL